MGQQHQKGKQWETNNTSKTLDSNAASQTFFARHLYMLSKTTLALS